MRERNRLTRRRWLAACGGAAAAGLAGCLGGDTDGGDGGDSDGTGDGTGGGDSGGVGDESPNGGDDAGGPGDGDEIQIVGEQVLSEEISGSSHWDYDLAEGETITVVMENDAEMQPMTGGIVKRPKMLEGDLAGTSGPDREVFQYTAEEASTYRVSAGTGQDETMSVEIYIQRN